MARKIRKGRDAWSREVTYLTICIADANEEKRDDEARQAHRGVEIRSMEQGLFLARVSEHACPVHPQDNPVLSNPPLHDVHVCLKAWEESLCNCLFLHTYLVALIKVCQKAELASLYVSMTFFALPSVFSKYTSLHLGALIKQCKDVTFMSRYTRL